MMMCAKEDSVERLIQGAMGCILEKGYNATSINDIVHAAGVPKGSFYYYFESKEAFVDDLLFRYGSEKQAKLLEIISNTSLSPLNQLRLFMAQYIEAMLTNNFKSGCLILRLSEEVGNSSPKIQATIHRLYQSMTELHYQIFSKAREVGEISTVDDIQSLAQSYMTAIQGALVGAKSTHSLKPFKTVHWLFFEQLGQPNHRLDEHYEALLLFNQELTPQLEPPISTGASA